MKKIFYVGLSCAIALVACKKKDAENANSTDDVITQASELADTEEPDSSFVYEYEVEEVGSDAAVDYHGNNIQSNNNSSKSTNANSNKNSQSNNVNKPASAYSQASTPSENDKYLIIVASFFTEEKANEQIKMFNKKGIETITIKRDHGLNMYHTRVAIESYSSFKDAKKALERVKLNFPQAWILVR